MWTTIFWGRSQWEGGVNESFESAQDEDDNRNTDAAVASGNLPPPPPPVVPSALAPHHHEVQDTDDIEGLTTAPSMLAFFAPVDVCGALKRAASSVKAQKTKNASNKNKECTLLAGAIVKLLEKDQSPSDGGHKHEHDAHETDGGNTQEHGQTCLLREARQEDGEEASQKCRNEEGKEEGKEGCPRREGGSWRQDQGREQQR